MARLRAIARAERRAAWRSVCGDERALVLHVEPCHAAEPVALLDDRELPALRGEDALVDSICARNADCRSAVATTLLASASRAASSS